MMQVNNAGVSFNELDENSVEHAEIVMKTNFYGPKLLIEALYPLFRRSPSITRILNISSRLGSLDKMRNAEMKAVLERENLLEEEIVEMASTFLRDVKNRTWESKGWPSYWTEYAVSKLALNAYSRVLAKKYSSNIGSSNLSVNCFCPGFTQTSMTNGKGVHTANHAASIIASLVLLPPHQLPTGKFFSIGSKQEKKSRTLIDISSKL
ncbi:putative oxidoreductase [Lupinus albus]|uniref:Putative oxidoreductase n=1 Tax=Lupinus albus TaxID=3870 RepID=A0A6A4Q0F5_LUPAL|nr:putative oxidoreductase [Lupinus albus]